MLCMNVWIGVLMKYQYLSQAPPDLGLDGRVHLLLIYGHCDKLIENSSDSLALGVIVVFAEANQIRQPRCHVFQTEMF